MVSKPGRMDKSNHDRTGASSHRSQMMYDLTEGPSQTYAHHCLITDARNNTK